MAGRTVIAIAHRLSTITAWTASSICRPADRRAGSHTELVARAAPTRDVPASRGFIGAA